jgi:hypothetical protein
MRIRFACAVKRPMETSLTPLEFACRAGKLYPEQITVIDGESRWMLLQPLCPQFGP